MGSFSLWHWIVVLVIVLLLFGGGRIAGVMGEFGKGLKSFKKGLAEDDDRTAPPPQIADAAPPPVTAPPHPAGEPRQL